MEAVSECVYVCVGRWEWGRVLVLGRSVVFQSTGVHRPQGQSSREGKGSSQVIMGKDQGEDQGLDGGDGLRVVRQVSQKHLCVTHNNTICVFVCLSLVTIAS